MGWEFIAPMVVAVVAIITFGGVAILRPIAKRLADLLDAYARDRQTGIEGEVHKIGDLLETIDARLQLMEERQDFTERLLSAGDRQSATASEGESDTTTP